MAFPNGELVGEFEGRKWEPQLTQALELGILTPGSGGNTDGRAHLLGDTGEDSSWPL